MARMSLRAAVWVAATLIGCGWLAIKPAHALSTEEAQASCRETVGRPTFKACMQGLKGNHAGHDANAEQCHAQSGPKVRACVQAALNKANGRANVAITVESGGKKEVIDLGRALPA